MNLNQLLSFHTLRSIYRDFSRSEMVLFVILLCAIIILALGKISLTYKTRTEVTEYAKLLRQHQELNNIFNNNELEYLVLTQNQYLSVQARSLYKLFPLSLYNQVFLELRKSPTFPSK